jgi:hypothetical protein
MKRAAVSDDDGSGDEDERAPKRTRSGPPPAAEFQDRKRDATFRSVHHPEQVLVNLLTQRQHVASTVPSFANDLKTGALTGPRLKSRGILRVSTAALPPPRMP